MMTTNTTIKFILLAAFLGLGASACGGGGNAGSGNGGGGGNGGTTGTTYTVQLTGVEMRDTRTGAAIDATGLPISGAIVTRN